MLKNKFLRRINVHMNFQINLRIPNHLADEIPAPSTYHTPNRFYNCSTREPCTNTRYRDIPRYTIRLNLRLIKDYFYIIGTESWKCTVNICKYTQYTVQHQYKLHQYTKIYCSICMIYTLNCIDNSHYSESKSKFYNYCQAI